MKDKAIQWFLGLLMCVSCIGCDDFLTQEPINAVTNQNYWETEKDARIAMNGLLSSFRDARGDVVVMYRDRGWPFDVLGTTWTKISNNDMSSYDATNPRFTWWPEYDAIAIANSIIANLHRIGLPEDRFNNYMGQARFIRAYLYFCVVRDFGDVPLLVKSEDIEAKPRTSGAEVLDFVINEYLECSKLLPPFSELKDSDGKTVTSKGVPCLGAVNAALAHAYAWKAGIYGHPELWNKVAEVCQEVINSGEYSLLGSPQEFNLIGLKGNSTEGIFEIDHSYDSSNDLKDYGSYIAGFCQRWPVQPMTTPTTKRTPRMSYTVFNQIYPDRNDKRRTANAEDPDYWEQQPSTTTQAAVYIKKWDKEHVVVWEDGPREGTIRFYRCNDILYRLPDIYLLCAEAYTHTGNVQGAIGYINVIRRRAGMRDYTTGEGELLMAVFEERERELFLEGHRYYDIVRFGYYREKLHGKFKTLTDEDVKNGALYLPVSPDMNRYNTLGTQTPYWKNVFPF